MDLALNVRKHEQHQPKRRFSQMFEEGTLEKKADDEERAATKAAEKAAWSTSPALHGHASGRPAV